VGHGHGGPTPERALWVAVALNAAFLVIEAVLGFLTGSLVLLSDAGHMVSDVGSLLVALVALRLARREPSEGYTFGLRRAPVLGGLVNGASLVAIVVLIVLEALQRFEDPPPVAAWPVFAGGVVGLAVNLGSAWYLARSRDRSVNTRGAMLHLLADALGSVAAIVAALVALAFDAPLADPVASLVVAVIILGGSLPLLRDSLRILLQAAPVDTEAARAIFTQHPQVRGVMDLHVWGLDVGQPVLSAILELDVTELDAANAITDALRDRLREELHVHHATIECRHLAAEDVDERF